MKKIVCFAGFLIFVFALTIGTTALMAQTDAAKKAAPTQTAKAAPQAVAKKITHQTICPVEGGKIDKKFYVDANGKRIYVCCQNCIATVKAESGQYITKMEGEGITLAKTPKVTKMVANAGAPKTPVAPKAPKAPAAGTK